MKAFHRQLKNGSVVYGWERTMHSLHHASVSQGRAIDLSVVVRTAPSIEHVQDLQKCSISSMQASDENKEIV